MKANQDIRNNINGWVEDTLFNVILRKQYDHSDKDKKLLYLYRLLAIKYRVTYPLKGESFMLDNDLRIVLETKICNAALKYASLIKLFQCYTRRSKANTIQESGSSCAAVCEQLQHWSQ